MLQNIGYTKYSSAIFQRQKLVPGSLTFWYLCTRTSYTLQMLPLSTLSSILALLELYLLGAYFSCYNIPVLFSIRSVLTSSFTVPFAG